MITQTTEYALRAVVCLAQEPGRRLTTPEIAETTQVPPGYLSKVLQLLGRSGIVVSRRGLGGGFSLRRPASELTLLEVLNAVDVVPRIRECPLGLEHHRDQLCTLHKLLDDAAANMEAAFARTTVADLLAGSEGGKVL